MTGINVFVSGYLSSDMIKLESSKGNPGFLGTVKYTLGDKVLDKEGNEKKKWIYLSFSTYADIADFSKLRKDDFIVLRGTLDNYFKDETKHWILRVEKLIFYDGQAKPETYNANFSKPLNIEPVKLDLGDTYTERDFLEFDKHWAEN